ncbi:MAG: cell filamentation protein Fic [Betaproteobacteria bacterium RIFCSPLOWO2_12_FULL_62_13]|nr:MAG: cell filamentation protein Fic [Betaproteobacteria bacterium RIFCSPLOWO2_12_FULL_62_13]
MANIATTRQDEIFITRGNESAAEVRAIQRRAKDGELTRIAEGVYIREKDPDTQKAVVRRNWFRILGALAPGAVVSYRSAYAGGLTTDGVVYLSHPRNFNRKIALPGVQAVLVKGPGPLPGDTPLGDGKLYFASRSRQILENLSPERGSRGKSAGAEAVEELLIKILHANGEAGLNRIRDDARALVEPLGFKDQFKKLDKLIGALLATHADGVLKTKEGKLVAKGTPVDPERMARFEVLATKLRAIVLPRRPAVATSEPARSHFAFLEAYFSNYVEGTEFEIEEARDIALEGRIVDRRPKDSHDILGVFRLALQSPGRDTVPPLGADFPEELARRHAQMLEKRPESSPGEFKLEPNRAGGTWFVDPHMVRGTLIEGSQLARSIPEGLARAIYYSFLATEVHPFNDGNGRMSRLVMNAELSRVGEARIIIPTLFHEEYVDCQRQLSRQDTPNGLIHALALMQQWTVAFDYTDVSALIESVRRTNALERSRVQFRLTMPDGSPLVSEQAT